MLSQLITSFLASAAFGVIFNAPKSSLFKCGLVGMIGWMVQLVLVEREIQYIFATFTAAFVVAVISQVFSKMFKKPMIIFSVAGIIPLVPGGTAYDAMRQVVENDYNTALQLATHAFLASGSIAIGLVFSEVVNQIMKKIRILILR